MKSSLLIGLVLFFVSETNISGCLAMGNTLKSNTGQYVVTVAVKENEMPIPIVMDVFIKVAVPVVNMQQFYLIQGQVEYKIICKAVSTRQLNELKDELTLLPGFLTADIKRIL